MNKHLELVGNFGAPRSDSEFGEPISLLDGRILQSILDPNGNFHVFIGDTAHKPDLETQLTFYPQAVPGALYTREELVILGEGHVHIGIVKVLKAIIGNTSVFEKQSRKPLAQPDEFYAKYVDIPFSDT